MKRPEYVYSTVSAYRVLLDKRSSPHEVQTQLSEALGRKATPFFLGGATPKEPIIDTESSGTGVLCGTVLSADGKVFSLVTDTSLNIGDHLRIHEDMDSEGGHIRIAGIQKSEDNAKTLRITYHGDVQAKTGTPVFLTARATSTRQWLPPDSRQGVQIKIMERCPIGQKILSSFNTAHHSPGGSQLKVARYFVRIDDPAWLPVINKTIQANKSSGIEGFILGFEKSVFENSEVLSRIPQQLRNKVTIALPQFIPEAEIPQWRQILFSLSNQGYGHYMAGNIGQRQLIDKKVFTADHWIWDLNRAAHSLLQKSGFSATTFSMEDDYLNIRTHAQSSSYAYMFGYVPLFVSRVAPHAQPELPITDLRRQKFLVHTKNALYYTTSSQPLGLFQKIPKFLEMGISQFIIDLSFCKPSENFLNQLLTCGKTNEKFPDSTMFNFKLGLR